MKIQINKEIRFGLNSLTTFKKFAVKTKRSKENLIKLIKNLKLKGKKIVGYGATAKATTVLNYCNIDNDVIDFFLDTTPDKANKYMPGKKIKILRYNKRFLKNANYLFLGAWNFKKEIFLKEKIYIKKGGKFITHIPIPKIL